MHLHSVKTKELKCQKNSVAGGLVCKLSGAQSSRRYQYWMSWGKREHQNIKHITQDQAALLLWLPTEVRQFPARDTDTKEQIRCKFLVLPLGRDEEGKKTVGLLIANWILMLSQLHRVTPAPDKIKIYLHSHNNTYLYIILCRAISHLYIIICRAISP